MRARLAALTCAGAFAGVMIGLGVSITRVEAQDGWIKPAPLGTPTAPPATQPSPQPSIGGTGTALTPARPLTGAGPGEPTWVQPRPVAGNRSGIAGTATTGDENTVRQTAERILTALRNSDAAALQRDLGGQRAGDPRANLNAVLAQSRGEAHSAIHETSGGVRSVFISGDRAQAVFCKKIDEVFVLELQRSGNEWKLADPGISRYKASAAAGTQQSEEANARAAAQRVLTALRNNDPNLLQRDLSGARAGDPRATLRAALEQARGTHDAIHAGGGNAQGVFIEGNRASVMFCSKPQELFAVQLEREGADWKVGENVITRFVQQ